jgi:hypothetical protein
MSEGRHDHGKNLIGTDRIELCLKSFILPVYDVLARHNRNFEDCTVVRSYAFALEHAHMEMVSA